MTRYLDLTPPGPPDDFDTALAWVLGLGALTYIAIIVSKALL